MALAYLTPMIMPWFLISACPASTQEVMRAARQGLSARCAPAIAERAGRGPQPRRDDYLVCRLPWKLTGAAPCGSSEAAHPAHAALELDPAARLARVAGVPLALTPKEYLLLEALLRYRGQVLTRTALFERLYDSRSEASDKVIEVLVSTLRAKLARAGLTDCVETRRGFGYVIP